MTGAWVELSVYEGESDLEKENCVLVSSGKNRMEQAAEDQPLTVSRLPSVVKAVGLPDLHPRWIPVGTAAPSKGVLYPHLLGNDIGCGMSPFDTGVKKKKFKQGKWVSRLEAVREPEDAPFSSPYEEECLIRDLGTLGGGNHFAEFQCAERIYDQGAVGSLGLCADHILPLVHCGSRGYGQEILSWFWVSEGLTDGSERAEAYMAEHDRALRWAVRNRRAVVQRLFVWLGGASEPELLVDSCHNYLEQTRDGLLHRKGSVSVSREAVVIPGPRGNLTYACVPREDMVVSLNSLSHGAGRKWARSICKSRIDQKYDRDPIRCTGLKNRVVCHNTNLLFAEAPEAYKNAEQVMGVLQEYGLIDIAATLRSLIMLKG